MRTPASSLLLALLDRGELPSTSAGKTGIPFETAASTTVGDSNPLLDEALGQIKYRQWARAQWALERLAGEKRVSEAAQYLAEVRAVRRCLRQLEKWPRDASLYLELGRLYFGLELGDGALEAFSRAADLQPDLALAHHLLALEYLYRGNRAAARRECEWAHAIDPELPSFADLEREFEHVEATA
ncbi:MAG: tetratricopeptide repeat protein [Chloroflexota bacterium]